MMILMMMMMRANNIDLLTMNVIKMQLIISCTIMLGHHQLK